jgi:hypothetical protein
MACAGSKPRPGRLLAAWLALRAGATSRGRRLSAGIRRQDWLGIRLGRDDARELLSQSSRCGGTRPTTSTNCVASPGRIGAFAAGER